MLRTDHRVIAVITSQPLHGQKAMDGSTSCSAGLHDNNDDRLADARFVADVLLAEGFELLNFHPIATTFAGSPAAFERVFDIRPIRRRFMVGRGHEVAGFDVAAEDVPQLSDLPPCFEGRAGCMAIARPPRLVDDVAMPVRDLDAADSPAWLLPDELAISIWADSASAPTETGRGIVAAQIGTGHYRHRFFSERNYRVLPTLLGPGQQQPLRDDHGHSTGEASYLFGAAPDLRLRPIKGLMDPVGDLLMAAESAPQPDLIINSWGYEADQSSWDDLDRADGNLFHYLKILEAVIGYVSACGVTVCAAMPKTWRSFPACHPDVIAIAARFGSRAAQQDNRDKDQSGLYPDRRVPDLWSDAARSVRVGVDLFSGIEPAQPGAALALPGLQGAGSDEAFAWADIERAASPLAASRLVLLLEQHAGISPVAFKAMVVDADRKADENGGEGDMSDGALIGMPTLSGESLRQLTGERSA